MEYGNMDTLMERNAFVTAERIRHGTYSTSKDSVPAHLMFMMRLFNDLCTLIHGRQHDHLLQKKKNLKKKKVIDTFREITMKPTRPFRLDTFIMFGLF